MPRQQIDRVLILHRQALIVQERHHFFRQLKFVPTLQIDIEEARIIIALLRLEPDVGLMFDQPIAAVGHRHQDVVVKLERRNLRHVANA